MIPLTAFIIMCGIWSIYYTKLLFEDMKEANLEGKGHGLQLIQLHEEVKQLNKRLDSINFKPGFK